MDGSFPTSCEAEVKSKLPKYTRPSIISDSFVNTKKLNVRKTSANKWSTMDGSFPISCEAEVKIKLAKLNFMAHIFAPFHVTSQTSNYDVTFGRDLLQERGNNLDSQNNFVEKKPRYP